MITTKPTITHISTRMLQYLYVLPLVLLSACAINPSLTSDQSTSDAHLAHEAVAQPSVEYSSFEPETLYALLVAEFAGNRNRFDIMLSNYTQQAQTTLDPGITARASRLARFINAVKPAVDMSDLWTQIEPENNEAHLNAVAALISDRQYAEALDHAKILLLRDAINGLDTLGANAARGSMDEVNLLSQEYQHLIEQYPETHELYLGACYLQQRLKKLEKALQTCQKAIQLSPDSLPARVQEARLLLQQGKVELSVSRFEALVNDHPDNTRVQLQYARALSRIDLQASAEQFEQLHAKLPNDVDITLALGLIHYQQQDFEHAKPILLKLTQQTRHTSSAHYYLGQIAIEQKDDTSAITHLSAVEPGSDYVNALSQMVQLLAASGRESEALTLIHERRNEFDQPLRENSYLLESQIYSRQGNYAEAVNVLNTGLGLFEDSIKLLYGRAMLYTEVNDIQRAELDLKRVIAATPNNPVALNALGYTLADKTNRLDEAHSYILRAYKLTPESAAVIDSLGWVLFRLGKHEKALTYLREAYKKLPDQEIAAHLGEALWATDNKDEALQVFKEILKNKPDALLIKQTLERLGIDL